MELPIFLRQGKSKYSQIYEQIKKAILNKTITAHSKLPSKRQLASQLGVSIHTVREAYEQLLAEEYIISRERSGYFVSTFEDEWQTKAMCKNKQVKSVSPLDNKVHIDFNSGHVDAASFPYQIWKRFIRQHSNGVNLMNSPWQGEWTLRTEIANYAARSRGVECEPDQVFLYSGTQMQLQELCQFFGLGLTIGMEEPGFIRAKAVFAKVGAKVIPIAVDDFGVSIPNEKVDVLYTTPAHQFPLGMIMSIERRTGLLKWAREQRSYIIEDDYDSEFRYSGLPIPSLAQLDTLQHVIYFGTFSKSLIPSIRMSYLILPANLVHSFEKFNEYQKSTVSRIEQLAVAEFMKEGQYDRHLAKMRTIYRKKHQVLLRAIRHFLHDDFEIIGENSGLHIILKLPSRMREEEAIRKALIKGVRVYPSSLSFTIEPKTNMVIIGYGGLTVKQIEEGVRMLADAWI